MLHLGSAADAPMVIVGPCPEAIRTLAAQPCAAAELCKCLSCCVGILWYKPGLRNITYAGAVMACPRRRRRRQASPRRSQCRQLSGARALTQLVPLPALRWTPLTILSGSLSGVCIHLDGWCGLACMNTRLGHDRNVGRERQCNFGAAGPCASV
jgi:hypothetical protein